MDQKNIEHLREILKKNVNLTEPMENIKNDDILFNYGMNSMAFVKVVVDIEKSYGFEFETDVMLAKNFQSVNDFITYIQQQLQNQES